VAKFFTQKTFASRIRAIQRERSRVYRKPYSPVKPPTLTGILTETVPAYQQLADQEATKGKNDHA